MIRECNISVHSHNFIQKITSINYLPSKYIFYHSFYVHHGFYTADGNLKNYFRSQNGAYKHNHTVEIKIVFLNKKYTFTWQTCPLFYA